MSDAQTYSGLALRQKTEGLVEARPSPKRKRVEDLSALSTKKLVHELQVHQIELEMQNEELLRAQVQLDTAKARYFDLYDLAPMGYCTLSEQGVVSEANLAAATLLGIPRTGLASEPLHRFIAKTSQDRYYLCQRAVTASGIAQDCELQVSLQICDEHTPASWVYLRMSATLDSGGVTVLRVVFHDISERKRLEAEAQAKSLGLEQAWQLADKANRAKAEFLSSMTHELRSPLNAILGFAQLLSMGATPPTSTQKSNIDQIVQAGWYLLDLVNEVLDLSLVESGQLAVTLGPVSLADVLMDCQATMAPLANKQGLQIHTHLPQPDCMLHADTARLKQVCIVLISNAIPYNRADGSIEIHCTTPTPGTMRVTVVDTGAGLSADKLGQLFQPFNRLGRESQNQEGIGIGLALSKRLIELMQGSVGAESQVGGGSAFWFELPLSAGSNAAHE